MSLVSKKDDSSRWFWVGMAVPLALYVDEFLPILQAVIDKLPMEARFMPFAAGSCLLAIMLFSGAHRLWRVAQMLQLLAQAMLFTSQFLYAMQYGIGAFLAVLSLLPFGAGLTILMKIKGRGQTVTLSGGFYKDRWHTALLVAIVLITSILVVFFVGGLGLLSP